MDIFHSIFAMRLIFILGIVNLAAGFLLLMSCRCIPGMSFGRRLMKYPAYQKFFKFHCSLWWVLIPSVIIHAVFAIGFFGIPS
jgi:hypothetical protein